MKNTSKATKRKANKRLEPLEALQDLREVKGWNDVEFNKRLDIIETALKQHKILMEAESLNMKNNLVLELIIEKKINVARLYEIFRKDLPWYVYNHIQDTHRHISKEEFELLKEVLK